MRSEPSGAVPWTVEKFSVTMAPFSSSRRETPRAPLRPGLRMGSISSE
jgi:hypothetical protein